ncbi:LuxR C-terminal-related transcriptional regulator [Pseudomonas sp. HK3]
MTSLFSRPTLLALLDRSANHKLTLIVSPSGYGKTTLLNQWQLTRVDLFIAHFCVPDENYSMNAALNKILLEVKKKTQVIEAPLFNVFTPDVQVDEHRLVDTLIQVFESIRKEFFFVIDDFQFLSKPYENRILNKLLERLPSHIHFIFSSRSIPNINLVPLKLNDAVLMIDSHDLALLDDDVQQLSKSICHYELTGYDIELIAKRTEGWFSGVKIALLAINEHGLDFVKNLEEERLDIMDCFFLDIYNSLSEEGRHFFLFSALFKRFNESLCNQVLGRDDSGKFIRYLMNRSAFIIQDAAHPGWYRYHTLLSDFLSKQLSQFSKDSKLKDLHQLSAVACIEMKDFELAAYHCRLTHNHGFIDQTLQQCCDYWLKLGDFSCVIQWLDSLGEDVLLKNKTLSLNYAYALVFSRRFNQAHYFLSLLNVSNSQCTCHESKLDFEFLTLSLTLFQQDEAFSDRSTIERLLSPANSSENRMSLLVIAAYFEMQRGQLDEALRLAHHAKSILAHKGYVFLQCYADLIIALCDRYTGRGLQAIQYVSKLYQSKKMIQGSMPWLCMNVAMMVVKYEQNELSASYDLCQMILPYVNHACITEVIATVYLYFSRLQFDFGSVRSARTVLEQLNRILILGKYPRFKIQILCERIRQCYVSGDHAMAGRLLSENNISLKNEVMPSAVSGTSFVETSERNILCVGYAHALNAQYKVARIKFERLADDLLSLGLVSRFIIAKCNAIVMEYRSGATKSAMNQMDLLIKKYSLSVFSRNVFDEAPGVNQILTALESHNIFCFPTLFLSVYDDIFDDVVPVKAMDVASLTEKEFMIFQLLKSGLSNQKISEETGVAISTTKWHLKNIYYKLGVKNRTEAIAMNAKQILALN